MNMRNYAHHIFGQNFLHKSLPPESYQQEFLCNIDDILKQTDICVHVKPAHSENHMGFCYELLIPPRAPPVFWYMNSVPTHYKDSSRTRSLQLSLSHLLFFLNSWATLDPDIHPVFNTGSNMGKICPAQIFPSNPRYVKTLIHTVYSRRGNPTCLQISVTLAGAIQFWELFKDFSSQTALQDQDITVKKSYLE